MNSINIQKESSGKFSITWDEFPEEKLQLDFNPILNQFKLNTGVILHWQSKPKSTRTKQGRCWGVYDIKSDSYFAGTAEEIPFFKGGTCRVLDIPEYKVSTVPTAVIYFSRLSARRANELIFLS